MCKPWKINGNHNNGWMRKRPHADYRSMDVSDGLDEWYEEHDIDDGWPIDDYYIEWMLEYNVK
jgi:hypothetical protein